jgi:hypothetical protein
MVSVYHGHATLALGAKLEGCGSKRERERLEKGRRFPRFRGSPRIL